MIFRRKRRSMELIMPEDGWDDRAVSYHCDICDRTMVWESCYINLDALIAMGMTQAELGLEIHRNDHHTYDKETKTWS